MTLPYQTPTLPIADRLTDLLARMTLEEKVGQMCQYVVPADLNLAAPAGSDADDATVTYSRAEAQSIPSLLKQGLIGSVLSETNLDRLNDLQALALSSRLGIPLLFGIDAIHGNAMHPGGSVYPDPISLAAAWDPALAQTIAEATALEMRAGNLHWTFSPNVDVARDGRWGRFGETFGEDPHLIGVLGEAMVRGYQGDLTDPSRHVLACAKHLIAGGEPPNGLNIAAMDLSERALREVFWPPFLKTVEAGVETVMAAHNDLNGVPCHANTDLLTGLLRQEAGFAGFVVSDWTDVSRLYTVHHVAETLKEADRLAVQAGIDMHMHGPGFFDEICESVREGHLDAGLVDAAARRILLAKFKLGLFEQPYPLQPQAKPAGADPAVRHLALEAARRCLVLLKNEPLPGGTRPLLPLDPARGPILVTGPNAHNQSLLGDWAGPQPPEHIVTVLDGLRAQAGQGVDVRYADVGDLLAITDEAIQAAVAQARGAAVVVAVVGENALRYTPTRTEGENVDRADLDLPGRQLELVRALAATGVPLVVVLVNGRPLSIPWIAGHVPAVLEALHPGMQGGRAIAEVVFGEYNPGGRLPFTVPVTVGQVRAIYNHRASDYLRKYRLTPNEPLYPFGHGLSYTRFEYSNLRLLASIHAGENLPVEVTLTNTGDRPGDEIAILYLSDLYASVTRPVKEVKDFRRVHLEPGESATVRFDLPASAFELLNARLERVIEPGTFEIAVGNLSGQVEII